MLDYPITIFLGLSVVLSMILLMSTKPIAPLAHMEKTNRTFAILTMIIVPLSLIANFVFAEKEFLPKIGLTLPLLFIIMAANKLVDDLKRLSLIKTNIEPNEQHFKNYSLSKREIEVAKLLTQGKTYKVISEELFVSLPTIKTHSSNIYKKCKSQQST